MFFTFLGQEVVPGLKALPAPALALAPAPAPVLVVALSLVPQGTLTALLKTTAAPALIPVVALLLAPHPHLSNQRSPQNNHPRPASLPLRPLPCQPRELPCPALAPVPAPVPPLLTASAKSC